MHNRIAGVLGRLSPHAHAIVSMAYHTIGAMNERLAVGAYGEMAQIATSLDAGELADDLFRPMRADESLHLGYYRTYAMQLRAVLSRWQLADAPIEVKCFYAADASCSDGLGAGSRW